jgi:branched-chain amino acid transport system permease protein
VTVLARLRRIPPARARRPAVAAALAALLLFPVVRPEAAYEQTVLLLAFLLAIQAVSWNIISGFAGYVSIGHSAFLGVGAYTAAILADRLGWNPLYFMPVAGVVAVVLAVAVGLVVLRTRGHAFVIITIALLLALQICAVNFSSVTKGSDGITLELPFWPRDYQNAPFYYLLLALLVVTFAFSAWVRRTKFGTGLVAIREDEGKAAAIGVNTTVYKVLAYAASAFFIGTAGAVYAYFLTFLNPLGAFNILASVAIVLAVLVGGKGTVWGPVIGAFIVHYATEAATVYGGGDRARLLLLGVALVLVVLFLPAGLLPTVQGWWHRRVAAGTTVEYTDQAGALGRRSPQVGDRPPAVQVAGERATARADGGGAGRPLLEVKGAVRAFGGLRAVDGVDLSVREGSITALIGPNGSGKTTLFNLVTGAMRMDAGEVWLDGQRIDRLAPWRRAHLGLGRTFQVTRLFKSMTVLENVTAPLPAFGWRALGADAVSGPEADRAHELLGFVGLARFAQAPAGTLSFGQQKLVELAQTLMLSPRLVLLDEPAGGINPSLVNRMVEIIRELNEAGVTFLVVEHNIPMVLDLCDPVAVLSRGRVISAGPPAQVRSDPAVLEAYLGPEWIGDGTADGTGDGRGPADPQAGARGTTEARR